MRKFLHAYVATVVAFWSLLLMPMMPALAAADTCTWTGAVDANWSNGGNWSGCDNGGVPETDDTLVFPVGGANTATNNDLSIVPADITVTGSGYSFNGNMVELSSDLAINATATFSSLVRFSASSGTAQLAVQSAIPVFSAGIDLNLTGSSSFFLFTTMSSLDLPAISGATPSFLMMGNPTSPVEVFNSSTLPSSFTSPGGVTIWRSGFNCQSDNCLGDDANPVVINGADAGDSAYLELNDSGLVLDNDITIDDTGVLVGPSRLVVAQDATTTGTITVDDDATISVDPSVSLLLNGNVTVTGASTLTYTVGSGGQITHNGTVSGSGNIIVDGYVQMINNNSYTGSTTVNSGAILIISTDSGLGTTAGATTVNSGGTLQFNPFAPISVAEDITVVGSGRSGSSGALEEYNATDDVTLTGNIALAGDTTIGQGLSGTANFMLNGPIDGSGDITINGLNTSAFTFGGTSANTYSGSLSLTGGQLYLSKTAGLTAITGDASVTGSPSANATIHIVNDNQIADTSNVSLVTNVGLGTLTLDANEQIATVTGDGDISMSAGNNLTQSSSTDSTFDGRIFQSSAGTAPQFIKAGAGTTTLTGTLYDASAGYPEFVVNGGKLLSNADFTNSAFAANSGGILGGSGSAGDVTVYSGGTLNVGNSPGCMTAVNLDLNSGANFDEELAGYTTCTEYDQTRVTNNANLNNATLNVLPSFTPSVGTIFTIIQAGSISGTFNGLADGTTFTANGIQFRINYTSTTVTLTVLGGTLAQTGANTSLITFAAIGLVFLALGGLAVERITRRRKYAQVK